MGGDREDWEKPRTRRDHFTAEEREFIRQQFRAGATANSVARALKAATRSIAEHYNRLRAEMNDKCIATSNYTSNYTARLYKPDFDL